MVAGMTGAAPTAAELAPLTALLDPEYPERLREVAERLYLQLAEEEDVAALLNPPRLAALALAQTERLSTELGGGNFYMHKGTNFRLSRKYRLIWDAFTGSNYAELARKFSLSEMRIRQIIEEIREQEIKARQGVLDV